MDFNSNLMSIADFFGFFIIFAVGKKILGILSGSSVSHDIHVNSWRVMSFSHIIDSLDDSSSNLSHLVKWGHVGELWITIEVQRFLLLIEK
jgi:hypothetical protein